LIASKKFLFCAHIYACQFRDELILLDTKKDKYSICSPEFSKLLINFLESSNSKTSLCHPSMQSLQDSDINRLIEVGIIELKDTNAALTIDRKPYSCGVSNADWRLPLDKVSISDFNSEVLNVLILLTKVNFYVNIKGLHSTIQLIKKSYDKKLHYVIPTQEELRSLASVVNKACVIYPTRTKCLEWAITYVLEALKRRWRCNLEIGVQNYPFLAHAWVECNKEVIMDEQDLRKELSIILSEPF